MQSAEIDAVHTMSSYINAELNWVENDLLQLQHLHLTNEDTVAQREETYSKLYTHNRVKTKSQISPLVTQDSPLWLVYLREGTDPISSPKEFNKWTLRSAELTSSWDILHVPYNDLHSTEWTAISWAWRYTNLTGIFLSHGFLCVSNNLHYKL